MAACFCGGIAHADLGALSCLLPMGGTVARLGVTHALGAARWDISFDGRDARGGAFVVGLDLPFPAQGPRRGTYTPDRRRANGRGSRVGPDAVFLVAHSATRLPHGR